MKLSAMLIAATVVAGALGSAAEAQHVERTVTTTTTTRAGPGYRHGWRNHHRHCRTEWHHHHRVTRCY